jgi:hypothetical protein
MSGSDAWRTLNAQGVQRQAVLRRQLNSLKYKSGSSMERHLLEAEQIRGDLLASGEQLTDIAYILAILDSLPSDYDLFKEVVSAQDMDLAKFKGLLLDRAAQFAGAHGGAFYTQNKSKFRVKKKSNDKTNTCHGCGKVGHIRPHCPDKAGGQSDNADFMFTMDSWQFSPNNWLVDSGASAHMTGNAEFFKELADLNHPRMITVGNGASLTTKSYWPCAPKPQKWQHYGA